MVIKIIRTRNEITKKQYETNKNIDKKSLNEFIESIAMKSLFNPIGYGCYPIGVMQDDDNKYYAIWGRYESCD